MKYIATTITLLLIVLIPSICSAQRTGSQTAAMMKESPAGEKVIRILKAINQELEVDERFLSTNFTKGLVEKMGSEDLATMLTSDIQAEDGSLTVYKINRPKIFEYHLTVKGEKSGWLTMVFLIDGNEPYRIKGFSFDNADKPAEVNDPMDL